MKRLLKSFGLLAIAITCGVALSLLIRGVEVNEDNFDTMSVMQTSPFVRKVLEQQKREAINEIQKKRALIKWLDEKLNDLNSCQKP